VTLPNNQTVEYELDAAGRRVGKRLNGVKQRGWLYDGALRVIAQTDAGGNVTQRYVYATQGHSPDYVIAGSATYRVVKDMLGSVRLVVDSVSGEVKQRIDYDVWGKVLSNSNSGFQPFGYAGGLLDSDTGLTRFGAREYDAESGRWVSKDLIRFAGGDTNLYAYVGGDPANYRDSTGFERYRDFYPPNWRPPDNEASRAGDKIIRDYFAEHWSEFFAPELMVLQVAAFEAIPFRYAGAAVAARLGKFIRCGSGAAQAAAAGTRTGGQLGKVLTSIEQGYRAAAPKTALEAYGVVENATSALGLETGYATVGQGGEIVLQNAGGITTTLGEQGSILVRRGESILLNLTR
jgi:RHS repeat-associated protein